MNTEHEISDNNDNNAFSITLQSLRSNKTKNYPSDSLFL